MLQINYVALLANSPNARTVVSQKAVILNGYHSSSDIIVLNNTNEWIWFFFYQGVEDPDFYVACQGIIHYLHMFIFFQNQTWKMHLTFLSRKYIFFIWKGKINFISSCWRTVQSVFSLSYENCLLYLPASTGPKASTLSDHWLMIWQENICIVVALTNIIENGKVGT